MRTIISLYALGAIMAGFLAYFGPDYLKAAHASDLGCVTDSECMRHCPPPADDPDCDGGPDDGSEAWLKREQARLCRIDPEHCEPKPQKPAIQIIVRG